ncbi:hypothetical protein BX600DRAFT_449827 [Xylariales sp. PMI_506]|nr:hypothetical protein BX600DRAFT_449827 [Xylariales sp. PMI_506]
MVFFFFSALVIAVILELKADRPMASVPTSILAPFANNIRISIFGACTYVSLMCKYACTQESYGMEGLYTARVPE